PNVSREGAKLAKLAKNQTPIFANLASLAPLREMSFFLPRGVRSIIMPTMIHMTRRLVSALLLLLLLTASAAAQSALAPSQPADVGMDAAALKEAVTLIEKAVGDDQLRGAVLLVARQGKI